MRKETYTVSLILAAALQLPSCGTVDGKPPVRPPFIIDASDFSDPVLVHRRSGGCVEGEGVYPARRIVRINFGIHGTEEETGSQYDPTCRW